MMTQQDDVLRCLNTSCIIGADEIERIASIKYAKRNSEQNMTITASTSTNLCVMSSSKGYITYICSNKKNAEIAIHYELPALLTRLFGLDQFEGAGSLLENIIRLDEAQTVATLDNAGIARLSERLKEQALRIDLMPAHRPRCDGEAHWLWEAWVKKETLGIEPDKRGHNARSCICPRKRWTGRKTFYLGDEWASLKGQNLEGLSQLLAAHRGHRA